MPSIAFGLVVEGAYDTAVFEVLIPRIHAGEARVVSSIEAGGTGRLMGNLAGYLRALEFADAGNPVDLAVVIRDANAKDPAEVEEDMAARLGGRRYHFRRGSRLHAVKRETETWLLADPDAITRVAGGRRAAEIRDALEEIQDPKARFRRALTDVGLPYTPGICAEIARELDIDTLRIRCPNFRLFEQKVRE